MLSNSKTPTFESIRTRDICVSVKRTTADAETDLYWALLEYPNKPYGYTVHADASLRQIESERVVSVAIFSYFRGTSLSLV